MNIYDILSGGIDKLVDSVGNAADKLFTSDEERLKLKNQLQEIKDKAKLEAENNLLKYEANITKRWQSDNEHAITRLVRPSIVVWSFALLTVVMIADGNIGGFAINPAYIPLLQTVVVTVTVAYFGSRGAEKVTKFLGNSKNEDR